MRQRISPDLRVIQAPAMQKAMEDFNEQGRARTLKRYGGSRSSKFYLIFGKRLYDTKALVAAAYHHETGKQLRHTKFGGGAQTKAVFNRLGYAKEQVFADSLGELRNLSTEYDRIPHPRTGLNELGFSKWIPLEKYSELKTGSLPGIYVVADSSQRPHGIRVIDKKVIYIGETVEQDLYRRLHQLNRSIKGKGGHPLGAKLRKINYHPKRLWLAIRSFPLRYGPDENAAKAFLSAQIRLLERTLLYEYVHTNREYPPGNSR